MTARAAAAISIGLLAGAACAGEPTPAGLAEPIVVRGGQFKPGVLPGSPPVDPPGGAAGASRITAIQTISGLAFAGQAGKAISGRASPDAVAIAVKFAGAGTGYWVQPLGVADLLNDGELTFDLRIDVSETAPPGNQKLELVAVDAGGAGGAQTQLSLCVDAVVPDNFNVCAPTLAPPAAVISLDWDSAADLDLQVTTPGGKRVDSKRPNTIGTGASAAEIAAGGIIDGDAQSGCRAAGPRRENLIWQQAPAPGGYQIRVNMFDACGAPSARFRVTLYTAQPADTGGDQLVQGQQTVGTLLSVGANGGATPGLYVGDIVF